MPPDRLVLGTHNRQKVAELLTLLAPLGIRLITLADEPGALADIAETGQTFAENAALKATAQALQLKAWVLGEDSGIVVDALDGRPGVFSARYAGPQATDAANNQKLLDELANTATERRTAHYVCQLALSDPQGQIRLQCGARCHGRIRSALAGNFGFGYDPLFEIVEYHRTFGELGLAVKAVLSHRARAVARFIDLWSSLGSIGPDNSG